MTRLQLAHSCGGRPFFFFFVRPTSLFTSTGRPLCPMNTIVRVETEAISTIQPYSCLLKIVHIHENGAPV